MIKWALLLVSSFLHVKRTTPLKGQSRDFLYLVFFTNQILLIPLEMSLGHFDFLQIYWPSKRHPVVLCTGELRLPRVLRVCTRELQKLIWWKSKIANMVLCTRKSRLLGVLCTRESWLLMSYVLCSHGSRSKMWKNFCGMQKFVLT